MPRKSKAEHSQPDAGRRAAAKSLSDWKREYIQFVTTWPHDSDQKYSAVERLTDKAEEALALMQYDVAAPGVDGKMQHGLMAVLTYARKQLERDPTLFRDERHEYFSYTTPAERSYRCQTSAEALITPVTWAIEELLNDCRCTAEQ
jgi:hypothetical protein